MEKISIDNRFVDLNPNSPEWSLIEYKLQLATGSTTAVVKKIQSLNNPNLVSTFEKKNKGALQIDSFMPKELLDEGSNRFEKIVEKGFDFPKSGIKFTVGFLKMQSQQGKTYEVIMYKIAVGKSYCMPAKNYSKDKVHKIQGFDSVYLYNEHQNQEYFKHQYILFENEQVVPCYLIQMDFDTNKELNLRPPACDNCNTNISKNYCITQEINLCAQCDLDLHKNKMALKHQRVDINDKPKAYGVCKQHAGSKLELFCTDCNQPICVSCKIVGNHANGQFGNHHIVKISDAYDRTIGLSKQEDPGLEKRKHKINQLLSTVDMKIKQINKKASQVEQQIYQVLHNALKQLRQITQKKMSYLIGDQLDLKRQFDQIQWMQSFLKYQHQHLTPSDFLSNWARHSRLRKQVLSLTNIPVVSEIIADMTITGKIQIKSDTMNIIDSSNQRNKIQNERIEVSTEFRKKLFGKNAGNKLDSMDKNDVVVSNSVLEGGGIGQDGMKTAKKSQVYPRKQGITQRR